MEMAAVPSPSPTTNTQRRRRLANDTSDAIPSPRSCGWSLATVAMLLADQQAFLLKQFHTGQTLDRTPPLDPRWREAGRLDEEGGSCPCFSR